MTSFRTRTARLAVAAVLTLGIAGTSTAAFATSPAFPHGPIDLAPGGGGPDDPRPEGPGDFTDAPPEPDCNPILASCDLAPNPGGGDGGGDEGTDPGPSVDGAVVANPTFTG